MSKKFYRNRNLGFGLNASDAEHIIADPYAVVAKDVVVGEGFVETRNGLTLFSEDTTKTGGITMMCSYYARDGITKELLFANADEYYTLPSTATPSTAWTSLGSYGTEVLNPFAYQYQNEIYLGTGLSSNTPYRYDGTSLDTVTVPADASGDTRFAEYHQGASIAYLLGGGNLRDNVNHNNSILYYTSDIDDWSTGGLIAIGNGDGQSLTAVKSHSNILAYKDNSMYRADIVYEEFTGNHVMRVLERFQDVGAINQEVCQVALNDVISLSQRHGIRGAQQVQTKDGGSTSRRLATKIKPLINLINWDVAKTSARAIVWNEKYLVAVPINGSTTNNVIFVGYLDRVTDIGELPWTLFAINAGSFNVFQDSNGLDRLLIGDSNQSKIYIWDNDSLSDNKVDISPVFRTKRIDMGDLEVDEFGDIIIAGLMTELTQLKVTVYVDGKGTDYVIKKEQILNTPEYIWSHVIGSEIVGGTSSDYTKPRFIAILSLPDSHRMGAEIQIEFSSRGQGYYWRIDYLSINEPLNFNLFADNHFVSAET